MASNYIPKAEAKLLEEQYKGYCEYCRYLQDYTSIRFHNEHIIPLVLKGKSEFMNLAKACSNCNMNKSAHISWEDPITKKSVPLFHPRKQNWTDHFEWSADKLYIIGKTPTGRATVELLDMNSPGIVNLRSILPVSEHPPK